MKKKPLVSIIITYFKKKEYILNTLNSLLDQTYNNYEVILVYDQKEKSDLKYLKDICRKFKKKRIIINKKNIGVSKSRNKAIKYARGSYIAFLDSDDLWKTNKLSYQINYMRKNSLLFTFTSYNVINDNNEILSIRKTSQDPNYNDLLKSNYIGLSTVIVSSNIKSSLKFPDLKTQEDFALWLKLLKKGYKLNHIKKLLSSWRLTKGSLSSNIYQKIRDAFKLFHSLENKNIVISIYYVILLSINKILKKFK